MSGDVQIELWLHEYKMEALAAVLAEKDTTVEQRMQDALTELYAALVPRETREAISARIKEDLSMQEAAIEASRKCAVFHVQENGREEYFRLDRGMEFLYAARMLRRYLRLEPGADTTNSFAELFRNRTPITAQEFDQLVCLRMGNTGKVDGAFELDFDKLEFSAVHIMDGWKTFTMGDVSAAAFHAFRKQGLSAEQRLETLLDKLSGREIPSAGHLSAREISFAEEISETSGLLSFKLETAFDVDAVFGTRLCTVGNDDTLSVYANYDMTSGQLCDELEVALHHDGVWTESLAYTLNAAEKSILLKKMDAYCRQQTGQPLAEYSAQRLAEGMAPPAGPTM